MVVRESLSVLEKKTDEFLNNINPELLKSVQLSAMSAQMKLIDELADGNPSKEDYCRFIRAIERVAGALEPYKFDERYKPSYEVLKKRILGVKEIINSKIEFAA